MAYLFDDASSQYLTGNFTMGVGRPITISAWVYVDALTADMTAVSIGDTSSAQNFWQLLIRSNGTGRFRAASSSGVQAATTTATASLNTWHSLIGVEVSNNNRYVWLDGSSGQNTNLVNVAPSPTDTRIGARADDGTNPDYFSGRVAEVAVWNGLLTPDAVQSLAAGADPTQIQPGILVEYWPLIRSARGIYGNTLTPTNSPTIAVHSPKIFYSFGEYKIFAPPSGTATSSSTSAFLAGQDTTTSNIPSYLNGSQDTQDNSPAYLAGQDTTQDSIPAFVVAQATATSSTPAYVEAGEPASSIPVYLTATSAPHISEMRDTFDDNSIDPNLWSMGSSSESFDDASVTTSETGQQLQIQPLGSTGGNHFYGVFSKSFDFTGGEVIVEAIQVPGNVGIDVKMHFSIQSGPRNEQQICSIWYDGSNTMNFGFKTHTAGWNAATTAYNATNHKYWKIRHNSGNIQWLTSADTVTWALQRNISVGGTEINLEQVVVHLWAGTTGSVTSPAAAIFDNLSIYPGTIKPVYLVGGIDVQASTPAFISVGVGSSSPAFTQGLSTTTDSAPAYMQGYGRQRMYPISDVSTGGWSPVGASSNAGAVNEWTYDNSDYAEADSADTTLEMLLSPVTKPFSFTYGDVRFYFYMRAANATDPAEVVDIYLYQGASTLIKDMSGETLFRTWGLHNIDVTQSEYDSITDWTDLRLRFVVGTLEAGENIQVAQAYLDLPRPIGRDSTSAFLSGGIITTSSTPAYMDADVGSTTPAYTVGQDTLTDNVPAYLAGQDSATGSSPAYLIGLDTTTTSTPAYTKGQDTQTSSQPAYLVGQDATLDSAVAYLAGQSALSSGKPAYLTGQGTATSSVPAYLVGSATSTSSAPAYLLGGQTSTGSVSAFLWADSYEDIPPDSDVTVGSWKNELGGSTLYTSIDESTPSDADYVYYDGATGSESFEVGLQDPVSDGDPTGRHFLIWRGAKIGGPGTVVMKAELIQGVAVICTDQQTLTGSYQLFTYELSQAEINAITDFTDLRIRVTVVSVT